MKTLYSDTGKGGTSWSLNAITDKSSLPQLGGIVLKDIQHDGHNFAKDIRLIAFWVFVDVVDGQGVVIKQEGSRLFLRSTGSMIATSVKELRPTPVKIPGFSPAD